MRAPGGLIKHTPDEMIVRCGASLSVAELDAALAAAGQFCPIDAPEPGATVGGACAVGRSGIRRLRYGPLRDLLLEARYVTASGTVAVAGAPLVKNVTGYDLCRLLVGSLGTIGLIGEVVLRCRPLPQRAQWFRAAGIGADVFGMRRAMFAPSSVLWDGADAWVLLEGDGAEVEAERARAGVRLDEVAGPPDLPTAARLSMTPNELTRWTPNSAGARFVAEVGIGIVHAEVALGRVMMPASEPDPSSERAHRLQTEIKATFDPTNRFAPGRRPW